eukprot:TRINITY_DN8895_c0_g1_i3.p1 TRINITY_DN8895_c0_g1~~TRINITY_DN8895_c0_g1_i3.p1  ORF type:complete len:102 (+),score=14.10 TRINITY_DN8895_c0_g1_i3:463-768(+)
MLMAAQARMRVQWQNFRADLKKKEYESEIERGYTKRELQNIIEKPFHKKQDTEGTFQNDISSGTPCQRHRISFCFPLCQRNSFLQSCQKRDFWLELAVTHH